MMNGRISIFLISKLSTNHGQTSFAGFRHPDSQIFSESSDERRRMSPHINQLFEVEKTWLF